MYAGKKIGKLYIEDESPGPDGSSGLKSTSAVQEEISAILESQYQYAKKLLQDHEAELHRLVKVLIERETLLGDEVEAILKKR